MSSGQEDGNRSGAEDQARRLAALRSLAARPTAPSGDGALADTQPRLARVATQMGRRDSRSRRNPLQMRNPRGNRPGALRTALIALFVVALLAGAGAWYLKSSGRLGRVAVSQAPMPAVRTINLAVYNYSCPMEPAWSPDGSKIAIRVTAGDCTNEQTGGYLLAIFDTRTGKLTNSIPLSRLLASQNLSSSLYPSPFVWTPDGKSLVAAIGYDPNQIVPASAKRGLLIVTLATGSTRLIGDATTHRQPAPGTTLIWDVTSGALAHTIAAMPPATTYNWEADGSLSPATDATPNHAVSVWQTGTIEPQFALAWNESTAPPPEQTQPQRFTYTSVQPRWSPDGRYLALPVIMGVRLAGGVDAFPLAGGCPAICQGTSVAAPNAGFSAILKAAEAGWKPSAQQPAMVNDEDVAWRADGQELATMLPGQDFEAQTSTATITIFDAQTGEIVRKLTISRIMTNFSYSSGGTNPPQIAWSPSGSSLAALNYADGTITLWRAE